MKRLGILLFTVLLSSYTLFAQDSNKGKDDKDTRPVISFTETTHNYGVIKYKGDGAAEFTFKNEGKEPLLLTKVRSSCGCTVPKTWPKEPIKAGDTATIEVKYNTRIVGAFSKSVWVYSNAKNSPVTLRIKGKVIQPNN